MRHLDTNAVVDIIRGKRPEVDRRFALARAEGLAISVGVLGERRAGIEKASDPSEATKVYAFLALLRIVPIDESVAEEYGRLRADLEVIGQKKEGNDLRIAATALTEAATLVTADEAFARVPALKIENWRLPMA